MAITGKASYSTHERVCALMDWASRKATLPRSAPWRTTPLPTRSSEGEPVKPLYLRVKEAVRQDAGAAARRRDGDLARQAREARERAEREVREKGRKNLKRNRDRPATSAASARST